jgi:glutathione synthase/RimK-type ligase-like ATP-grasp enzyme
MGSTVFAARIDSQTNPDEVGRTDWRMGQNIAMSYSLPDAVAEKCRTIVKEYGLAFGAIDLIKTPDGRYVFLELNPNGQWAWLEELTGDPYIETFVKLLSK